MGHRALATVFAAATMSLPVAAQPSPDEVMAALTEADRQHFHGVVARGTATVLDLARHQESTQAFTYAAFRDAESGPGVHSAFWCEIQGTLRLQPGDPPFPEQVGGQSGKGLVATSVFTVIRHPDYFVESRMYSDYLYEDGGYGPETPVMHHIAVRPVRVDVVHGNEWPPFLLGRGFTAVIKEIESVSVDDEGRLIVRAAGGLLPESVWGKWRLILDPKAQYLAVEAHYGSSVGLSIVCTKTQEIDGLTYPVAVNVQGMGPHGGNFECREITIERQGAREAIEEREATLRPPFAFERGEYRVWYLDGVGGHRKVYPNPAVRYDASTGESIVAR